MIVAASPAVQADCINRPHPFVAKYNLYRSGDLLGTSIMILEQLPDGTWRYTLRSEGESGLAGFLQADYTETSRWTVAENGMITLEYFRMENIAWHEETATMEFDREHQVVRGVTEEEEWVIRNPPETPLDRLLVNLKLVHDLSCGVRDLSYRVVDDGDVEKWRFYRVGRETVKTPAGRFEAVKVAKEHSSPARETLSWFVPEKHWLAVRIEHVEDAESERLTMVLREYSVGMEAVTRYYQSNEELRELVRSLR